MCEIACPVHINTGDLVRRLRAENSHALAKGAWSAAARGWQAVSRGSALALTTAAQLPETLPMAATETGRSILGKDHVPSYDRMLPRGGPPRPRLNDQEPAAVFFAACVCSMFGPENGGHGASGATIALCKRVG